ncbi:MAG: TorF family putative porin [Halioglobus sp.]|nr:TorF family putative porin [Halioglobus sp.]
MSTRKLLSAVLSAALLPMAGHALSGGADGGIAVSGNIALTSDYRFRGISQSDESPAIQGGFDVEFSPGFYLGTWGSSVDFDSNDGYDGSLELDYYAGWAGSIGASGIGLDVGYIYYDYPGDNGAKGDYQEVYLKTSWRNLTLGAAYSDDYYAQTDEFWYLSGDYSVPLTDTLSLGLHAGYNMLEQGGGFLSSDEDAYTDYSVSLTWSGAGVDISLAYVGTDLDDRDVFGTDWADDTAIIAISKRL